MSLSLPARTLRRLDLDAETSIPADAEVVVVGVVTQGAPRWMFEWAGRRFEAPLDALSPVLVRPPEALTFDEMVTEFLALEGLGQEGGSGGSAHPRETEPPSASPPPPSTWGEPGEGRPSLAEINAFPAELARQERDAGTMSREEFLNRKAVLLERIRRADEEGR